MDWQTLAISLAGISVSCLVGVGALLVSALTLWLSDKSRASAHTERLYPIQHEAYRNLMRAVHGVFIAAAGLQALNGDLPENPFNYDNRRKKTREKLVVLTSTLLENRLVLSNAMTEHLVEFIHQIEELARVTGQMDSSDQPTYAAKLKELHTAYANLVQGARQELGTDPLSPAALQVFGKSSASSSQIKDDQIVPGAPAAVSNDMVPAAPAAYETLKPIPADAIL
jgi:hypothetical protein